MDAQQVIDQAPDMVRVMVGAEVDTLTVAGLIRKLQEHVEIDPERAGMPVAIWQIQGNKRLLPAIVSHSGNSDPEIGGHQQVVLFSVKGEVGPSR